MIREDSLLFTPNNVHVKTNIHVNLSCIGYKWKRFIHHDLIAYALLLKYTRPYNIVTYLVIYILIVGYDHRNPDGKHNDKILRICGPEIEPNMGLK